MIMYLRTITLRNRDFGEIVVDLSKADPVFEQDTDKVLDGYCNVAGSKVHFVVNQFIEGGMWHRIITLQKADVQCLLDKADPVSVELHHIMSVASRLADSAWGAFRQNPQLVIVKETRVRERFCLLTWLKEFALSLIGIFPDRKKELTLATGSYMTLSLVNSYLHKIGYFRA